MRIINKLLISFLGFFFIFLPFGTDIKYQLLKKMEKRESSLQVTKQADYNARYVKEKTYKVQKTPSPTPSPTPKPTPTPTPKPRLVPKIEAMSYTKDQFIINQEVTLKQVISEEKNREKERNFYIEIYSSRPFGDYLLADNVAKIPAGETKVQIENTYSFDTPGTLFTLVKIYDKKGGKLLLEEKGTVQRTVDYRITSKNQLRGLDLFSTVDRTSAQAFKEAGYSFVARYYSENEGKRIYREEAQIINEAGLQLVTVYQDANHTYECFTYENGYQECKNAIAQAIEIGQPVTTPIYFSVDFNAEPHNINVVFDYFEGVNAAMADFTKNDSLKRFWKIGGYGSYFVVKSLDEKKLVSYLWQTLSWSEEQQYNYNFYQNEHEKIVAGQRVDLNFTNPNKGNDVGGFYVKSKLSP